MAILLLLYLPRFRSWARLARWHGEKSSQFVSGFPLRVSRIEAGAWDGLAKLDLAMMKVCSIAKHPERTAWGTTSVNTIQVVFGGNSNRYLGHSRWYSELAFK
jgi:hypothetical protein